MRDVPRKWLQLILFSSKVVQFSLRNIGFTMLYYLVVWGKDNSTLCFYSLMYSEYPHSYLVDVRISRAVLSLLVVSTNPPPESVFGVFLWFVCWAATMLWQQWRLSMKLVEPTKECNAFRNNISTDINLNKLFE